MQGEPGFERLKRELEELKNAPRGLEGTYRTAAEMERHRAQAADAAIEEQLEVQTAFREHGAKLQGIYEVKQRTETEMSRREQEMKQLNSGPPAHVPVNVPVPVPVPARDTSLQLQAMPSPAHLCCAQKCSISQHSMAVPNTAFCLASCLCHAAGWRATVNGLADKFARPLAVLQHDMLSPAAGSGLPDANGHAHSALESGIEQFIPLNMFESAHRGGAMRPQLLHQHLHERQKNRSQFHKVRVLFAAADVQLSAASMEACTFISSRILHNACQPAASSSILWGISCSNVIILMSCLMRRTCGASCTLTRTTGRSSPPSRTSCAALTSAWRTGEPPCSTWRWPSSTWPAMTLGQPSAPSLSCRSCRCQPLTVLGLGCSCCQTAAACPQLAAMVPAYLMLHVLTAALETTGWVS